MSEYTEQADRFLAAHGLTFKAVYIEHGKHFPEDKESRDIYRLELRRVKPVFTGGTLQAFSGRRVSFRFGQCIAHSTGENVQAPRAYDLLAALTKYDPGTFANFCGDYGTNEDSISGLRTYKAVCREWAKVSRFFTAGELAELADIN